MEDIIRYICDAKVSHKDLETAFAG